MLLSVKMSWQDLMGAGRFATALESGSAIFTGPHSYLLWLASSDGNRSDFFAFAENTI